MNDERIKGLCRELQVAKAARRQFDRDIGRINDLLDSECAGVRRRWAALTACCGRAGMYARRNVWLDVGHDGTVRVCASLRLHPVKGTEFDVSFLATEENLKTVAAQVRMVVDLYRKPEVAK